MTVAELNNLLFMVLGLIRNRARRSNEAQAVLSALCLAFPACRPFNAARTFYQYGQYKAAMTVLAAQFGAEAQIVAGEEIS